MAKRGKKYIAIKKKQPSDVKTLSEGIDAAKKLSYSKFEGSIEVHLATKLPKDVDAKSLKGSISLPNSVSKKEIKIAVFTTADRESEAAKAGADFSNMAELIKNVKAGKIEFDIAIATPSAMPQMAALGKELGPKGLMPNPKTGTVTDDIESVVKEYKQGKVNFASDAQGVFHFGVGKVSQDTAQIVENVKAVVKRVSEIVGKGSSQIVKTVYVAPTMGPSVQVELTYED